MAKLGEGRTSALTFDGSAILFVQSGEITLNTVTGTPQTAGGTLVPWNATIQKAYYSVRTTSTVTSLLLQLGTTADDDAFLDDYRYDASAAGVYEIPLNSTANSSFVSASVSAGNVVQWKFNANTVAASGVVGAFAVISPNAA